jgi:hypothetical protein
MAHKQHKHRVHRLSSGATVTTFPPPPPGLRLIDATDSELAHYGVPPRPNRETEHGLYNQWKKVFGRQMTFISPELRESTRVRRQFPADLTENGTLSPTWSGVASVPYPGRSVGRSVMAQWDVPIVKNVDADLDRCSIWVGIGGYSQDPADSLLQAGIECLADASGVPQYYAWWEWLSRTVIVYETIIEKFEVVPGCYIQVVIWVTSDTTANITMDCSGPSGVQSVLLGVTAPAGIHLQGGSAEWIVERPRVGGALATLVNYGTVEFWNAMAWCADNYTIFPDSGTEIAMQDDGGVVVSRGHKYIGKPIKCTCTYGT